MDRMPYVIFDEYAPVIKPFIEVWRAEASWPSFVTGATYVQLPSRPSYVSQEVLDADVVDKVHHKGHRQLDALAAKERMRRASKNKACALMGVLLDQANATASEETVSQKRLRRQIEKNNRNNADFGSW